MTTPGILERHLASRAISKVLYGSIVVLALEVALEDEHPPAPHVIASIIGTGLAVAFAELYSDVIALEINRKRRPTSVEVAEIARKVSGVAVGAAFPVVFFGLAWAGVISVERAFEASIWTGLGLVGLYGFAAARLAGNGVVRAVLQASVMLLIGVAIIFVKSLFK